MGGVGFFPERLLVVMVMMLNEGIVRTCVFSSGGAWEVCSDPGPGTTTPPHDAGCPPWDYTLLICPDMTVMGITVSALKALNPNTPTLNPTMPGGTALKALRLRTVSLSRFFLSCLLRAMALSFACLLLVGRRSEWPFIICQFCCNILRLGVWWCIVAHVGLCGWM